MSWGDDTTGLRAGWERTPEQEHSEAIFPTSSFTFRSAAEAAARFSGEESGNIYSRFTNPTVRAFENRLAAMEGGERAIATASGMSAILSLCMGLLRTGDHVICSLGVFGTTSSLFANQLSRFGVHTDFVSPTDVDAWAGAMRPETQMLFLETPSNPLTEVADIRALADLAHAHDARLVVDNCFCTSALQRPLDWGADIVSHSATKYLDGQGRCVGGALVGDADTLDRHIFPVLRTAGPTMSPFNAWVFLKGLETLNLRMRAHSEQAAALAEWLRSHPAVTRVFYSGLADHPQHALAARQQKAFGGIVSFEVAGGRAAAWSVIDHTRMLSITANLGDTRSTITHPATTTHGRVPADQREAMGIQEGLVRVSVGLEDLTDIQTDLDHGLSRIRQGG
ncbi:MULTISPECIES: O-succinylhomoserine sulfhydrylase [Spiribacter]|uniref:O-succinylhomoserine sulfhydrylase n=2 Tax=Spiribacter TaxID=1335745 RepID=A0A557RHB9_9GAMM|nr:MULTISPECIES: O-succinylhomoserine sulfhydrylase [Spiribacter]PZA00195.1 O-succinylhomoserine sulfhydrylase [Gammaproteobacteria bacterium 2W06]AUB78773.1 O-succinylhomoserine sulfhydrylase [Spiribacter roseus]KAF0280718.1 O-succinylhomoserine sulfhydrylase [Spiribacter roseus]KAF0281501.1 O-succinylhomoserine sulfhydrylase [Spiribacter roseus]KAF0284331.1 O-succinylhomoserine sulfhydrylase [Spiribacter roseus]